MRTYEEIRRRVAEIGDRDFFGFESGDLLGALPREELPALALKDLPAEYKPEGLDRESVLGRMREYMTFALDKAENHRGLSASRSISHFRAWVWLLGDEDFKAVDWENYAPYGVPILKQICVRYEFPNPFSGILARMATGEPCQHDCEGCTG
jgi:hypothetical protein